MDFGGLVQWVVGVFGYRGFCGLGVRHGGESYGLGVMGVREEGCV